MLTALEELIINTNTLLDIIIKAAENKKAHDLKVLDIRKTSNLVDFLIICTGQSPPQIDAIKKEVDIKLRDKKIKHHRWEGPASSGWIVLDLGAIVLHIMSDTARKFYNLEELWEKDAIIFHN